MSTKKKNDVQPNETKGESNVAPQSKKPTQENTEKQEPKQKKEVQEPKQKKEISKQQQNGNEKPNQKDQSTPSQPQQTTSNKPQNNNNQKQNANPKKKDESKGRFKPVPDKPFIFAEDKKALDDLHRKLVQYDNEVNELSQKIIERQEKREEIRENRRRIKGVLIPIEKRIKSQEEKKKAVEDQIAQEDKIKKQKSDEAAAIKKVVDEKWGAFYKSPLDPNNKPANLGKLEGRIKALEQKLSSTSMPLMEEKKLVAEINGLNSLKTIVKDYHQKMYEANTSHRSEHNEKRLKEIEEKIAEQKIEETKSNEEMQSFNKLYDENESVLDDLAAKRRAANKNYRDAEEELQRVNQKISDQKAKYIEEKEKERKKREEEKEQKRKEKEEARQKRTAERLAKEAKIRPFEDDVRACDRLVKKLESLIPAKKDSETAETPAPPLKKDLKHPVEILALFEMLSLPIPKKIDNLQESIDQVKKKKQYYLQLRSQLPAPVVDETDKLLKEEKENNEEEEEKKEELTENKKENEVEKKEEDSKEESKKEDDVTEIRKDSENKTENTSNENVEHKE